MIPSVGREIKLEGLVQFQGATSAVDSVTDWDEELRRMRVQLDGNAGHGLTARLQADFDSNRARIRDAWADWRVTPALTLRAGQFKPPFNVIELTSAKRLLVIERGNRIRGSRVQTTSDLVANLHYAARNRGAMGTLRLARDRITLQGGWWLGSGEANENNDGQEFGGRLEWAAIPAAEDGPRPLTLGVAAMTNGFFGRPRETLLVSGLDSLRVEDATYGTALEAAAEYGEYGRSGLHVIANALVGDNALSFVLEDGNPELGTFRGFQVWGEFLLPFSSFLSGIGPALRFDHLDPDTDVDDDATLLLTPGLNLYFGSIFKIQANVDVLDPEREGADTLTALRVQTQVVF